MPRLPESLDILRLRDFRLLFSGQAVSVFGDRMVAVALAFAVLETGGSPSEVGLVLAAAMFPLVGSVLVGGAVADRATQVKPIRPLVFVALTEGLFALPLAFSRPPHPCRCWPAARCSRAPG